MSRSHLRNKSIEALYNEGYSFPDLLPYLDEQDGVFVLHDGSLGKIWKLEPLGIEGKNKEALLSLVERWEGLLMRIPNEQLACQIILASNGNVLHRLSEYSKYQEDQQSLASNLTTSKVIHMGKHEDEVLNQKPQKFFPRTLALYVAIRYFPNWESSTIFKKSNLDEEMGSHLAEFSKYSNLVEEILQSAGVTHVNLDGEQLVNWLYRLLNPKRRKNIPIISYCESKPLRDQIVYNSPSASGEGFNFEGMCTRTITLKELPGLTSVGMFTREFYEGSKFCLLDMSCDYILTVNLIIPDSHEAMKRLNLQKSFAYMHQDNLLGDKSVEAVEKKKELDETIANIFKDGGRMVQARFHWNILAEGEDCAEAACNELLSGLNRLGCEGLREELIGGSLFLTCLPLNFDPYYERFIRRSRRLSSSNAADMLPVFGSFAGTKTPASMYLNRRGEIVFLDFFDSNINPHALVIGASGAGKSFLINDFILQNYRLGAHFFVLDKGDSYKKLCTLLKGSYTVFDLNHPVTINPFANNPTPENLSFLLSLLSQMASGGDERDRLSREEEGLLHRAISKAYETRLENEATLSDVVNILNDNSFNDEFGINSMMGPTLALRLTPFTKKGPYGGFFDGQNQFNIRNMFTVFELANLSAYPDLQIAVLLNLMFFMTNFVASPQMKPKRKYMLIDEAWSLLKVKNTADFITNAFKTFRKYRCSVVAITQEMSDLTRQESGIAIIANASNKIFLKQEPAMIDMLKEKVSLDEEIIKVLKTVETVKGKFSEGFVMTDSACGVVRLVPDPFLYWVANSEPRNNDYLFEMARLCDGDLIEAINKCAKEYPYGL